MENHLLVGPMGLALVVIVVEVVLAAREAEVVPVEEVLGTQGAAAIDDEPLAVRALAPVVVAVVDELAAERAGVAVLVV